MATIGFLEVAVMALAGVNGFILLVRPVGRFHARLDVLEARLQAIDALLAEMRDQLYS